MAGEGITRRSFLALAAIGSVSARALVARALAAPRQGAGEREVVIVPRRTEIEFGPLGRRAVWAYNGQLPGREIRVREGDRLRAIVRNELPEPTTVHWHGVPVPNRMDGVVSPARWDPA